ncbi:hypothetical protein CONCODRAFT_70523 [Conidiobolus coronatus NRRL 28638]|uniref:Chromo domain-containing protein n=1 Tax=Conidiobolus coronatus (strain ATCC 28846 / CBS 209.66 / NRRL 28638) TaxID=796925 RepID=A0A137P6D6_CONC2|nr:hypothetical protein CONCODRAFT_70523 [Conidiobolus coronatus NRRL 28638]|eukprot:KXN70577.1 hypothetical protein CONCODRAFT_70523 [Conidiobolus coronatus NRRL 28638]
MPLTKKTKLDHKAAKAEEKGDNKSENKSEVDNSDSIEEGSEGDEPVYYIDYILDHKRDDKGNYEYFIRWLNYDSSHDSWSKETDIFDKECIQEYWAGLEREKLKDARAHTKSTDQIIPLETETLLDHDPPNIWARRWADEFKSIDGISKREDGSKWGYIAWKGGCHTCHPLSEVEEKIPQQLLSYYLNLSFPKN